MPLGAVKITVKIISNYRDYYDLVSWVYSSDEVLYNRMEEWWCRGSLSDTDKKIFKPIIDQLADSPYFDGVSLDALVVCGRVYPYLNGSYNSPTSMQKAWEKAPEYKESFRDIWDQVVEGCMSFMVLKAQRIDMKRGDKAWLNYWSNQPEISPEVHRYVGAPVFYIREDTLNRRDWKKGRLETSRLKLYCNPRLQDLGFQHIMRPSTIHQTIEQYLMGPMKEPPQDPDPIPDDCMRDMKGFDEWAFKKRKGK